MNQEEQILELNQIVKATIGVSKVHGVGVFAIRDIQKGRTVFADRMPRLYHISPGNIDKLLPEVKKIILERWPLVMQGERFAFPDVRLVSLMNHASTPNYDPVTDTALEDIRAGEEIFESYCQIPDAEKIYPWLVCLKDAIIK